MDMMFSTVHFVKSQSEEGPMELQPPKCKFNCINIFFFFFPSSVHHAFGLKRSRYFMVTMSQQHHFATSAILFLGILLIAAVFSYHNQMLLKHTFKFLVQFNCSVSVQLLFLNRCHEESTSCKCLNDQSACLSRILAKLACL